MRGREREGGETHTHACAHVVSVTYRTGRWNESDESREEERMRKTRRGSGVVTSRENMQGMDREPNTRRGQCQERSEAGSSGFRMRGTYGTEAEAGVGR